MKSGPRVEEETMSGAAGEKAEMVCVG